MKELPVPGFGLPIKYIPKPRSLLLIVLLISLILTGGRVLATPDKSPRLQQTPQPSQDNFQVFLPSVHAQYYYPPSVFGVHPDPYMFKHNSIPKIIPNMVALPVTWVRYDGVHWAEIESTRGERDWDLLERFERDIRELNLSGFTPIVTVRDTPAWAQKYPGIQCGPIREDSLDEFASFMKDLAQRYSEYPTKVDYWEIWNEPDVDPSLVKPDSHFGCWGDESKSDYGGDYYGKMLQYTYPAIKTANPNAKVVLGGVLLHCDPDNPPEGDDCLPSRFLEGVFHQAPASFDIINFHGYAYWWPNIKEDWDLSHLYWGHRGGVILGQLDYLNQLQEKYGIDKPVLASESGLVCHEANSACPSEEFFNAQANYVIRLYTRSFAHDMYGALWFTIDSPGWRWGALLDENYQPRPAYESYKFFTTILRKAEYIEQLSRGDLEGYHVKLDGSRYQIYWSNHQDKNFTIPLPDGAKGVYDKFGEDVTPSGTNLIVGFEPRIIAIP